MNPSHRWLFVAASVAALFAAYRRHLGRRGEPLLGELTSQALGAWQKAEIEKWWPIVKEAGIKAE